MTVFEKQNDEDTYNLVNVKTVTDKADAIINDMTISDPHIFNNHLNKHIRNSIISRIIVDFYLVDTGVKKITNGGIIRIYANIDTAYIIVVSMNDGYVLYNVNDV